jgi:hypothetical protein
MTMEKALISGGIEMAGSFLLLILLGVPLLLLVFLCIALKSTIHRSKS